MGIIGYYEFRFGKHQCDSDDITSQKPPETFKYLYHLPILFR